VQDALLKLYRGESWRAMEDERAFLAGVVLRSALGRLGSRLGGFADGAELRVEEWMGLDEKAVEAVKQYRVQTGDEEWEAGEGGSLYRRELYDF
jgi:hypothetical protein